MNGKKTFTLILTVALAAFFIGPNGLGKLFGFMGTDVDALAEMFLLPTGFMKLVGALELAGGVGLLLPRTRKLAALGLVGLMIGAVGTHIRAPATIGMLPLPLLTGAALVVLLRLNGAATASGTD